MDLPLFRFDFNVDENWLIRFKHEIETYSSILLPNYITQSEKATFSTLIENWMNTMRLHAIVNEKNESPIEDFQVHFKFPRYNLKVITSIKRVPA